MKLEQIASLISGTLDGDGSIEINGVRGVKDAREGDITFLGSGKYLKFLQGSSASAVITAERVETSLPQIIVAKPELAFARLISEFHPEPIAKPGIHSSVAFGDNVKLGDNVSLASGVSIGSNVVIGDGVVLHANVVIGDDCLIGDHSILHPNVTLYRNSELGRHVILHSGVVIGADGFGYTVDEVGRHFKINQVGRVVIEDHVEIGANSCVDRAALDTTLIKEGTKIDNLVQVAHNCTVGEHSILVSQVGLAGSVTLGHHVVLAGQVGVGDHVTLGDQVTLTARSGTFRDVESNSVVSGFPVVPNAQWKREMASLPKLPDLIKQVRKLEARLEAME